MTHPSKPPLRALRCPFDDARYPVVITQEFGNVASFEPAVYNFGDGVYGWVWEPGCTQANTHTGRDYGLNRDTPLLAVADGTIRATVQPADSYGFGNLTVLDAGGGLLVFYAHQNKFGCAPGQKVTKGQPMGFVGTTGNSSGDHLHFATGADDGSGYYCFFSPVPYLMYQVPPTQQLPTAGKYTVLVPMMLRTQPRLDSPHTVLVTAGTVVTADGGWQTHWRECRVPDGKTGWLFAQNLAAA